MEITWLGHSCFRLRGKDATLLTDPCDKNTGYSIGRPTADIITISHDHPGHANVGAVPGSPRVINGPGEYEISNVLITGVTTYHDTEKGAKQGRNTAYVIEMDEMLVCHLGDLGHVPTSDQVEELSGADILFIPVGGGTTLGATAAAEVVSQLEPKLVVPMHYATSASKGELEPLDRFIKEMGAQAPESVPKLSITRSGLPQQTRVLVIEYKS